MTKTPLQNSEHAIHRLVMARLAGNSRDINYWFCRVEYWTERVIEERITGKHPPP